MNLAKSDEIKVTNLQPEPQTAPKAQVHHGQKSPFTVEDVTTIRASRVLDRPRDRALFELAISSALRASDLLSLRVADVKDAAGVIRETAAIAQRKTGKPVRFIIAPAARAALSAHIAAAGLEPSAYLFTALRRRVAKPLTVEAFRQLVKAWADAAGHRDVSRYAAHSTRRTLAVRIYSETGDVAKVSKVLGHRSTGPTLTYLGVDENAALATALEYAL